MTKDEALKLALEALTNAYWPTESDLVPAHNIKECADAITAIKEALAQPEQKPVAWPHKYGCRANAFGECDMGCVTPPQRTWVGLTDEERSSFWAADQMTNEEWQQLFAAIEAKLKEKNT